MHSERRGVGRRAGARLFPLTPHMSTPTSRIRARCRAPTRRKTGAPCDPRAQLRLRFAACADSVQTSCHEWPLCPEKRQLSSEEIRSNLHGATRLSSDGPRLHPDSRVSDRQKLELAMEGLARRGVRAGHIVPWRLPSDHPPQRVRPTGRTQAMPTRFWPHSTDKEPYLGRLRPRLGGFRPTSGLFGLVSSGLGWHLQQRLFSTISLWFRPNSGRSRPKFGPTSANIGLVMARCGRPDSGRRRPSLGPLRPSWYRCWPSSGRLRTTGRLRRYCR